MGLEVKPCIIVCFETRTLDFYKCFNSIRSKLYSNNSNTTSFDRVVGYIKENLTKSTVVNKQGILSILKNNLKIEIKIY